MHKQATYENDFMDLVILSFTSDNFLVRKKISTYQKNLEVTNSDNDINLIKAKQILDERIAMAEKVMSVTKLSRKKIQLLREKVNPSDAEKEEINILDNANNVCQIVSFIGLIELATKHNDQDMLRYGKEKANDCIDKLYGNQSELLKHHFREWLELFNIPEK